MKRTLNLIITALIALVSWAQTDTLSLPDVVVTGARTVTDVRHLPMTVTVINHQDLTAWHRDNVLPAVSEQVPGLFVSGRAMMGYGVSGGAAGGINMRGISGGSGQLLVLIDGHPQFNGIYGHPISDSYQTLLAERVEVLRGPASVLYGSNAMGGVINIVTRQAKQDGSSTDLSLSAGSFGTFQASLANRWRHQRISTTVAANYGRSDNHRPRMGFQQYGGYAKVGYDFNANWNAFVDFNITHFNASIPGTVSAPLWNADQWITRGVANLAIENHYERTSGAISVFTNFGQHKIDDGTANPDEPTQRYFRSRDILTGVSIYQSITAFRGNRITVGFDYQNIYGKAYYTSKATGEVLDTPNKQSGQSSRHEFAAYAEVRQDFTKWLTADAGIRFDHHSVVGSEWIPQFGLVFRPIASGEIKLQAAKGFRFPTMREMYLYPPSNTLLRPERLWNFELSWRHRALQGGALSYGLNLFYIKADNIIQTAMIDGRPRNINSGKLTNYGIEADVRYRINGYWTVTTNHSLLKMKNPVLAAPKYKGYFGADFSRDKWQARAGLQVISGLYKSVGDNPLTESFVLLNASVGYRVIKPLRLWIKGENLLAQRYEINAGYPMPKATFMVGVDLHF